MRTIAIAAVVLTSLSAAPVSAAGDWPEKAGGIERPDGDAGARGAPARDGDVAIRQEFRAAEAAGTIDAYRTFAWRHPDHRLARVAIARIEALIAER